MTIRRNPTVTALYQRLGAAGKPGKLALTACIRERLTIIRERLTILNAVIRDQRPLARHLTRKTVSQQRSAPSSSRRAS
jgi:hypothetical protein